MKNKFMVGFATLLITSSVFAADFSKRTNDELYKMIATSDTKTLSEVGFEIHKRAGKLQKESAEIMNGFHNEMRKKMNGLSDEQKRDFIREFRKNMNEKVEKLSVKEARDMGFFMKKNGKRQICKKGKISDAK